MTIGTFVFFAYNNKSSQTADEKQDKKQQQPIEPLKSRNMLLSQHYYDQKTLCKMKS